MLDDLAMQKEEKRKKKENTKNRKKNGWHEKESSDARKKRTFSLDLSLQNLQRESLFGSAGNVVREKVRCDEIFF